MEEELIKVDKEFSAYSLQFGMNKAFYLYAAEEAVMLRDNAMPLIGRENIKALFAQRDDSKFTFSWEPLKARMAKSGDMGFTYGTYRIESEDTITEGTYVSVWEKDAKGNWKYILDSGNEGLGK